MSGPCAKAGCYAHDGQQCADGGERTTCPYLKGHTATVDPSFAQAADDDGGRVCWSGQALGIDDLGNLTPRARSITIGLLGDYDAGKTTMLVGAYLSLLRGEHLAEARFAGSRTLGAWEALASWARPSDAAQPASFPPHTSIGAGRAPGLLHLALRRGDDQLRDVLLTDAPGEWFTRWAMDKAAAAAEGARWVVDHADVLVVVLDSARLAGPKRGAARGDAQLLIERLGNHRSGRPALVVWTKADHQPAEGIRRQIQETVERHLTGAKRAETTTERPQSLAAAISEAITLGWDAPRARALIPAQSDDDPFLIYRGTYGR